MKLPHGIETWSLDSRTIAAAEIALGGERLARRYTKLLPFLGPAFIAAVAYVDPEIMQQTSRAERSSVTGCFGLSLAATALPCLFSCFQPNSASLQEETWLNSAGNTFPNRLSGACG